jgi:hypothetical protein
LDTAVGDAKTSGCVAASKSTVAAIQKNPTAYHVNVHYEQVPGQAPSADTAPTCPPGDFKRGGRANQVERSERNLTVRAVGVA